MPVIQENVSLKPYNTFGVEAKARYFVQVDQESDLGEIFSDPALKRLPLLVLGGGSNMLFTKDFDGVVLRLNIQGISNRIENDDIYIRAGAGVIWNDLVQYCVSNSFPGMENLSLIPGTVGASPVQNIGAYGVELMDIFFSCRAFEIATGQIRTFSNEECDFSYRESIFKGRIKGQYIITEVTYLLHQYTPINTKYGAITEELANRGITNPGIKDVSEVVSAIRVSKLPDPSTIGNAGSFFKNPIIGVDKFRQLQSTFPDIVHFPAGPDKIKLAAGWLIDQCGFKGVVSGNTGTWKNQALVLVNHGNATGNEVFNFSVTVIEAVEKRFNVTLEREVNII